MSGHRNIAARAVKGGDIMKKLFFLFAVPLFCLIAAAEDPNSYRVLVLGDVHYDRSDLHADPRFGNQKAHVRNLAMWKAATPALLAQAGALAKAESAAFVVQLGDITQGYAGTAELQTRMLTEGVAVVKAYFPQTPLLIVRGNHDVSVLKGTADDRSPADASKAGVAVFHIVMLRVCAFLLPIAGSV